MSLRQFGLAFLWVIIFMAVWAIILLAIIYFIRARGMSDGQLVVIILVLTVVIIVSFLPYLNYVAKRVFAARGEGPALPEEQLRRQLEELNTFDAPVTVEEKKGTYIFTWRYVDAKWWEMFRKAGLTETYALHVKLNGNRHTATLTEVTRSVNWGTSVDSVQFGSSASRGVVSGWERGIAWGIQENFAPGKLYDYTFSPAIIKNPVINTLLRNGWDVRFAIF